MSKERKRRGRDVRNVLSIGAWRHASRSPMSGMGIFRFRGPFPLFLVGAGPTSVTTGTRKAGERKHAS